LTYTFAGATVLKKLRTMPVKTTAPLIELHGYTKEEAEELKELLKKNLESLLGKKNFSNLVFSFCPTEVVDIKGNPRPFIRFYSTEYVIVHQIEQYLRKIKWKGEIEFNKITQFHDLR
jgi:hypothetical protein